jgi:hypothetical protein
MGAEFDSTTINMKVGGNLMEVLKEALFEKGQADLIDSEDGLFFVNNVHVTAIHDDEVELKVEYEYGG